MPMPAQRPPHAGAPADRSDPRSYTRVAAVLGWLGEHWQEQPSLEAVARVAGLGPHHFQRVFTQHVGVSPKKYLQFLTLGHAKRSLDDSASVLDAAFDAGLSGPGRLHDLFVSHEGLTPGEWKAQGAGLDLRYGWHASPFGESLIVAAPRGVCGLAFRDGTRAATLADLARNFAGAALVEDPTTTAAYAARAFAGGDIHLVLRGTPFQLKVWEALLRIPPGATVSYAGLAGRLGRPGAARAVAGAVAFNPVSWLIPCHRVLRGDGSITGYRWSPARKRVLLAWEAAQAARETAA
jgi:AraC family transcriptional regulator of adaptative response/methylated-DNA-[protein]-cysteine methyltransferase